jgi:hypothetical protein
MTLKYSSQQLAAVIFWLDPMIKVYFKLRYGPHWLWYYINFEQNQEIML